MEIKAVAKKNSDFVIQFGETILVKTDQSWHSVTIEQRHILLIEGFSPLAKYDVIVSDSDGPNGSESIFVPPYIIKVESDIQSIRNIDKNDVEKMFGGIIKTGESVIVFNDVLLSNPIFSSRDNTENKFVLSRIIGYSQNSINFVLDKYGRRKRALFLLDRQDIPIGSGLVYVGKIPVKFSEMKEKFPTKYDISGLTRGTTENLLKNIEKAIPESNAFFVDFVTNSIDYFAMIYGLQK